MRQGLIFILIILTCILSIKCKKSSSSSSDESGSGNGKKFKKSTKKKPIDLWKNADTEEESEAHDQWLKDAIDKNPELLEDIFDDSIRYKQCQMQELFCLGLPIDCIQYENCTIFVTGERLLDINFKAKYFSSMLIKKIRIEVMGRLDTARYPLGQWFAVGIGGNQSMDDHLIFECAHDPTRGPSWRLAWTLLRALSRNQTLLPLQMVSHCYP